MKNSAIDHEALQGELAAYSLDRLEGEARVRVEEHLATCEQCAGVLASTRRIATALRGVEDDAASSHPDVASVRFYALGLDSPGASSDVGRHVELCTSCSLEAEGWRRAPASGLAAVESARRLTGKQEAGPSRWIIPAASLAAGLALGYFGRPLLHSPRLSGEAPSTAATAPAGSRPTDAPAPSEAAPRPIGSAATTAVLELFNAPRDPVDDLIFDVGRHGTITAKIHVDTLDPPEAVGALRFQITDVGGGIVWSTLLGTHAVETVLRAGPVFEFPLAAVTFPPGDYELRVIRAAGRSDLPLVLRRFRIAGEPPSR